MVQPKAQSPYTNTFNAFAIIFRQEGVAGLYRGLAPSLLGISHVAVQFPLYEKFKLLFSANQMDYQHSSLQIIVASAASKIIASSVTYPHEVYIFSHRIGYQN